MKYFFLSNWDGKRHEYNSLKDAVEEAKGEMGLVTIFDKDGRPVQDVAGVAYYA